MLPRGYVQGVQKPNRSQLALYHREICVQSVQDGAGLHDSPDPYGALLSGRRYQASKIKNNR